MDNIRLFPPVKVHKPVKGTPLSNRIEAASLDWEGKMAESGGLEAVGKFSFRGYQQYFATRLADRIRQWKTKIKEIPGGVCKEDDFQWISANKGGIRTEKNGVLIIG